MLFALCVPLFGAVLTIPRSPDEMVRRARRHRRQIVKLVVPDDQRSYKVFGAVPIQGTSAPEDLDPWPGGLKQQYPIALGLARELLQTRASPARASGSSPTRCSTRRTRAASSWRRQRTGCGRETDVWCSVDFASLSSPGRHAS